MRQVYVAYDGKDAPTADRFNYCPQCKTALTFKEIDYKRRPVCPSCGFIRFQNPAPAVSLLIVKDEQVLLGRRGRDPGRGQWATPSGYIEYEDDFLTTAIREAKEETGLDVELKSIVHVVSSFTSSGYHFLSIYLLAGVVGGELGAGDDLDAVDWFPLAGPWPDLAFQEDVDLLETYSTTKSEGLPIDPNFRARRGRVQEIERSEWLKERRRVGEERYDTLFAPIYDENWGAWIGPTHQECIQRFLSLCPPQGAILDAACGTGKYWPLILASGRRVWGTDQSEGMLARA